jgi:hypothetical protein
MTKKAIRPFLLLLALCLILLASEAPPAARAVAPDQVDSLPGPAVLVRLDPEVRQRYVAPPAASLRKLAAPDQAGGANIVVNYLGAGWTAEARVAFEYAANIWEALITSPVPIEIDAEFSVLGTGVLGAAGPTYISRNFPNAPQSNTWYPIATANKLSGEDNAPSSAEIQATFNSSYANWYFGTGNTTPADKINFSTVVLHELGHGLGFLGSMNVDNGSGDAECSGVAGVGCYGSVGDPLIYDRFTENGAGTALLDFANNSTALGSQLTGGSLFFNSPGANFANGGSRVPLYAPSPWQPGSSYSHLAQGYDSTPNALMTFSVSRGETILNPGLVALCMFEDMGWTVNESCNTAAISGLTAVNDGPATVGVPVQLSATISSGSNVSYEWDFGDGNRGSGAVVSHQYAAPGVYTAEVTASNPASQETAATTVTVNEPPISGLTAANDGPKIVGLATLLTASVSSGSNVSYEWDFGDGNSGSGAAVSHQYAVPGVYTAQVTATNPVSQETAATTVTVNEAPFRLYTPLLATP